VCGLTRIDYVTISLFRPWNRFKDEWLVSPQAAKLFFVCTLLVLGTTPLFFGKIDTTKMTFWARLPWGVLGTLGPFATFLLWFGMWRYWIRIDNSKGYVKRFWFVVLLFGLWWGSCLYCYCVYLPQVFRKADQRSIPL
jgi:hypothetical protein